jgi:Histidine kinase/Histidine kinase-, DNA gyrase B-, and HSP90-like ATPase
MEVMGRKLTAKSELILGLCIGLVVIFFETAGDRKGSTGKWRWIQSIIIPVVYLVLCFYPQAQGLQPSTQLTPYGHTAWRLGQSGLDGSPLAITQTADGYIWVGTHDGLFRFDGVRFARWTPLADEKLPSSVTKYLLGMPDGNLYIATESGVARLTHGHLYTYPEKLRYAGPFLKDEQGDVWTGEWGSPDSSKMRFDERMEERTRLARELHDTLLQTIQGSKLVADEATKNIEDLDTAKAVLNRLSVWLGQATREGRAALESLRNSTTEENNLGAAFRQVFGDCSVYCRMELNLSVMGASREMHPIARDEVYHIGYEAIRNACFHSKGTRLNIELSYSRNLLLRIADDGRGIDPDALQYGKEGHYGLTGMRERAARIGAKIDFSSSEKGTAVTLNVPGSTIFQPQSESRLTRILRLFRRSKAAHHN